MLSPVVAGIVALLLICLPFTVGAIWAFPIWDDSWLWLLIKERGVDAIAPAFSDRPVNARLWDLLAISEQVFWFIGLVAQTITWPIFGVMAALLWDRLFPSLRRYALLVGCVAVAPFVTKVQMVTVNIALASLLSIVLAYGALLLLLRFVATDSQARGRVALLVSLPLLSLAILIQEYALPVVSVTLIILWSRLWLAPDAATKTRARSAILLVTLFAGASYGLYLLLADPGARPNVRPLNALALGGQEMVRLPFLLVGSVWRGLMGGFADSLSEIGWTSKWDLLAVTYGLIVACLLVHGSREPQVTSSNDRDKRDILLLVITLTAGLLPVLVMGRIPWDPGDGMSSRFGLPVLPILAALTVRTAISLVRRSLWAVPVVLIGFTAGHAAFSESRSAITERRAMAALGARLQSQVSLNSGYTVAVVPLRERSLGPPRQWELTARLTATWPPELRKKFWAYRAGGGPALSYNEDADKIFGARADCLSPSNIDVRMKMGPSLDRGVTRQGHLERLLWVRWESDGSISLEPYCLGDHGRKATIDSAATRKESPG